MYKFIILNCGILKVFISRGSSQLIKTIYRRQNYAQPGITTDPPQNGRRRPTTAPKPRRLLRRRDPNPLPPPAPPLTRTNQSWSTRRSFFRSTPSRLQKPPLLGRRIPELPIPNNRAMRSRSASRVLHFCLQQMQTPLVESCSRNVLHTGF